jgi:cold shock CspA family protein
VHVHSGGQAVVGMVETPGGGDREKSKDQAHAKQIAHAPQPAMSGLCRMSVAQTKPSAPARLSGRVKWFDFSKKFGFITASDGRDLFVHDSDCPYGSPQEGERVSFEIGADRKGRPCAVRVEIITGNDPR